MKPEKLIIPVLIVLAFTMTPSFALPQQDHKQNPLIRLAAKDSMSVERAAAMVRKQTGGRVLSTDTQTHNGQTIYRIKVLMPSGVVKVVRVDATTGQLR